MESFALEKLAVELNGTPLGAKDSLYQSSRFKNLRRKLIVFRQRCKFLATLSPNAGAVITTEALANEITATQNFIIVDNPYLAYAKATQLFFEKYNEKMQRLSQKLAQMSLLEKTM